MSRAPSRLHPSREEFMKVDGRDHAEPAKPTPAPGQFQQILQRTEALLPSRTPAAPPLSLLPGPGKPVPRPPLNAAPHPASTVRIPALVPAPASSIPRLLGTAIASGPVLATARSALASPENLGQARQVMHGEALRLRTVRTESQTTAQERTEHRLSELISREVARELRAAPAPLVSAQAAPPPSEAPRGATPAEGLSMAGEPRIAASVANTAPLESTNPQPKVQAALELIEKIEVFVRSQRPALRMSLGWPLSALVEVERTGPREVALRIQGQHRPLAQEDLTRIREALGARGLRLRSLHAE